MNGPPENPPAGNLRKQIGYGQNAAHKKDRREFGVPDIISRMFMIVEPDFLFWRILRTTQIKL